MVREGYRQTEIGAIPEDWEVKQLRTALKTNPQYGINAAAVAYQGDLPTYIRITDILEDSYFKPEKLVSVKHSSASQYFLEEGDLVFARTGASVGKSYLYRPQDGRLVYAGFLIRVQSDKAVLLPSFLSQYVKTKAYWNWVQLMSMRSGQPGINGNEYGQLLLPVPKLEEQRRIAQALSDVDALIAALDKLIAKKRNLKTATMQQLLTGKKRLSGFGEGRGYKESAIRWIPEDWDAAKLGDIAEVIMGPSPKGTSYNRDGNGLALINGPTEFTEKHPIKVQWTTEPTKLCKSEDLLLCVRGSSTGQMNVANDKFCIGRGVAANRANAKANTEYITYQVYLAIEGLLLLSAGSTFPSVDGKAIKSIPIPCPDPQEQRAIATVLSDMDAEIAALESRLAKTQALKWGMMQELLTGRTRLV